MKKSSKKAKPEHAGIMRNDLAGYMKLRGNKIYVRWKGKDISTGCDNTVLGWKAANIFWEKKVKELIAIEKGEKEKADSILNIFKKFLDYKRKITRITKQTEQCYITSFNSVFTNPNEIMSENSIKKQLENFIKTTTVSDQTINNYLRAISTFLSWASDDDNGYIPIRNYTKKYKQKPVSKIKPPYTDEEYQKLLAYFEAKGDKTELILLLQFLWNTGARVGESLKIKLSDLDLQNKRILVSNKIYKGKQEALLLIPEAVKVVEQAKELAIKRGDTKLFSWKKTCYPNESVRRAELNLDMRIKGRGLHGFRRAFSNRLCNSKLSIIDIQEAMRHGSIDITMKYYKEFRPDKLIKKMSEVL